MDQEKIKKLLEIVDDQEKIRLTVVHNAAVNGLKNYNSTPTSANANNWKRAEKELDEQIKNLWEKYIEPPEASFENILKVVEYLTSAGYQIKKSTAYNHKKEGKLLPGKDGKFKKSVVDKYAALHLKPLDGRAQDSLEKLNEEKIKSELERSREQVKRLKLQNSVLEKLYVPKDAFERELAQRAMIFKADLEMFCRSKAANVVALVGGDKDRIPDLIEYMLGESAGWLNRYAADREFIVPAPAVGEVFADQDEEIDEE